MQERARQEGAWGLFRLLEAGTVTRPSNQVFTIAWQLRTHDVTLRVDFRAVRADSPFFGETQHGEEPQLLEMFRAAAARVPTQIVPTGPSCRN
jgi:type VI protein secretion system component VasK